MQGDTSNESFFKHAAVYGLANLLLKGGGFVLLPIYLRCLSQHDNGVLEYVGRLAETVGACLLFGGFRQGLLTFHQQAETEPQRRRLICSALLLYGVFALLGGGIALLVLPHLCDQAAPFLAEMFGKPTQLSMGLLRLAILTILLEPFSLVPLTLLQARVESVAYVIVVVGQLLLRISLAIALVRFLNWGATGALAATACTGVVFGLTLTTRELLRGVACPSMQHIRGLIRFALPLMPGGLCYFVLNSGDQFFLKHYRSFEEVGIYALGYKLALTVGIFSLNPLYMVWSARMYSAARLPEAPVIFGRMFTRILAAYVIVGLGMCLFGDFAVALMGGARYARASIVIAPVLLGCICQGAVSLMDAGLYVTHRSSVKFGVTLAGTLVMLALYWLLIPPWGIMGGALATLGGFAFLAVLTWVVTQRIFPVSYEWGRLVLLLALAVGLWLLGQPLPTSAWTLPLRAGLWLLGPLLAWLCGLMSDEEKADVRRLARQGRRLLLQRGRPFAAPGGQPVAGPRRHGGPSRRAEEPMRVLTSVRRQG
jgi:O-antigen/teichoic acid export membrane protein